PGVRRVSVVAVDLRAVVDGAEPRVLRRQVVGFAVAQHGIWNRHFTWRATAKDHQRKQQSCFGHEKVTSKGNAKQVCTQFKPLRRCNPGQPSCRWCRRTPEDEPGNALLPTPRTSLALLCLASPDSLAEFVG